VISSSLFPALRFQSCCFQFSGFKSRRFQSSRFQFYASKSHFLGTCFSRSIHHQRGCGFVFRLQLYLKWLQTSVSMIKDYALNIYTTITKDKVMALPFGRVVYCSTDSQSGAYKKRSTRFDMTKAVGYEIMFRKGTRSTPEGSEELSAGTHSDYEMHDKMPIITEVWEFVPFNRELPPAQTRLCDAWMVIVSNYCTPAERANKWPADHDKKGLPRPSRIPLPPYG
jgi:hypothetical protein